MVSSTSDRTLCSCDPSELLPDWVARLALAYARIDEQGRIVAVSDAFARLADQAVSQIHGCCLFTLVAFDPGDEPALRSLLVDARAPIDLRGTLKTVRGVRRSLSFRASFAPPGGAERRRRSSSRTTSPSGLRSSCVWANRPAAAR